MEVMVNVIVPVYNTAEYLAVFFSSLEKQSVQNFRLFLVNDASTDCSKVIILSFKEKFGDRFVYIENNRNLKLSEARNVGLIEAEKYPAKYLTFLDSDDWVEPTFFEHLISCAEEHELDIAMCGLVRFEDSTNKIVCTEMNRFKRQLFDHPQDCDDLAYINPSVYTKLFRSDKIKGLRFLPIKRSEDTCFFLEALSEVGKIGFTNTLEYHYRLRKNSLSGAIGYDKCESMYEEFKKLLIKFTESKYKNYKDFLETQIFIRSAVGGVCRVSFSDMGQVKKYVGQAYHFLETEMAGWRNNQFLSFRSGFGKNYKQFAVKMGALMYKLHVFPLFVWAYYVLSQKIKKDVRL